MEQTLTTAIIVAAGSGARMGSQVPKQYLEIAGIPVIARTLQIVTRHPDISGTVVVVPPGETDNVRERILDKYALANIISVVEGGATRFESVKNGMAVLSQAPAQYILIHDGVRPLVEPGLISACIREAQVHGAAIAAIPVTDTIKRVDEAGYVVETPDRAQLWQVQTPQVFKYQLFMKALDRFSAARIPTDDAMLVESLGEKVKIVQSNEKNIKITSPADLLMAETILKESCP